MGGRRAAFLAPARTPPCTGLHRLQLAPLPFIADLPITTLARIAGNAMHVPSVGSILAWTFAYTEQFLTLTASVPAAGGKVASPASKTCAPGQPEVADTPSPSSPARPEPPSDRASPGPEPDECTTEIALDPTDPTAVIVSFLQTYLREGSRGSEVGKNKRSRDIFPLPYVPEESVSRGPSAVASGCHSNFVSWCTAVVVGLNLLAGTCPPTVRGPSTPASGRFMRESSPMSRDCIVGLPTWT